MSPRRKLFIAHAGELAHLLIHNVGRGGWVARFVRSYAERHNRRALLGNRGRLRELEYLIGREALLVMAVELRRRLPGAFSNRKGAPAPEETALAEAFFAEFVAALGRALEWPPAEASAEAAAFLGDLEMYQQWSGRPAVRPAMVSGGESPFADRCALLLDPAMMEQARRAAAGFEIEFVRAAAQIFAQLGRPISSGRKLRRPTAPRSRPRSRSASRPKPGPAAKQTRKSPPRRKPAARPRKLKAKRGHSFHKVNKKDRLR